MLLVNQTKDLILNTNTIGSLYIEKKSNSIKAHVLGDNIPYHLGTYQSLDDCKLILDRIIEAHQRLNTTLVYYMPFGGGIR